MGDTPRDARAVEAAAQLRQALEGLARSLAALRLDGLLRAESALEVALAGAPAMAGAPPSDRDALRREVERAARALARARRLGAALGDLATLALEAQGRGRGYGRSGDTLAPAAMGRQLDTTG